MGAYVDRLQRHGARFWCHLIADSLTELHDIAQRAGMRREWFQDSPPASFPHYDMQPSRRAAALALGAVELDRTAFVMKLLRRLPEYSATPLARVHPKREAHNG